MMDYTKSPGIAMIGMFAVAVIISMSTPVFADEQIEYLIKLVPLEAGDRTDASIITIQNKEYEVVTTEQPATIGYIPGLKIQGNESDGYEITLKGVGLSDDFEISSEDIERELEDKRDDEIAFILFIIAMVSIMSVFSFAVLKIK